MQIKIIDPGHKYGLPVLDAKDRTKRTTIQFVKRIGKKFPGNTGVPIPGATVQFFLRAIIHRLEYVNKQDKHWATSAAKFLCSCTVWLLECRAANRHGLHYYKSLKFSYNADMCEECGHTVCKHKIR